MPRPSPLPSPPSSLPRACLSQCVSLWTAASWRTPNGELWNVPDEGAYLGDTPIHVAWEAMEQLVLDGLVREIGISNVSTWLRHGSNKPVPL